jgi:zinc transporter ZupT
LYELCELVDASADKARAIADYTGPLNKQKPLSNPLSEPSTHMNFDAVFLAIVTCFSTLLGGTFAARRRKNIGILGAFAAGVLITTSLLDLLPQTFRLATSVNVLREDVMALTVVGFLFLYIISRLIIAHVFNKEG